MVRYDIVHKMLWTIISPVAGRTIKAVSTILYMNMKNSCRLSPQNVDLSPPSG